MALGTLALTQTTEPDQTSQDSEENAKPEIEVRGWYKKPGWRGRGPMPRHHLVATWGIPEPYDTMTNPLPKRHEILARGRSIYTEHCASCHGRTGAGDGSEGRDLSPSPGNLVWLSDVPEKLWDPYIYWTTAEGGVMLGTDMPAYDDTLSDEEIWAVSAYIQANLPFVSQWRFK
ncbi:MAG: cytochrome c [Novosphingobium sp.]|nr:cytochrome c [Novosphingobium sp.]